MRSLIRSIGFETDGVYFYNYRNFSTATLFLDASNWRVIWGFKYYKEDTIKIRPQTDEYIFQKKDTIKTQPQMDEYIFHKEDTMKAQPQMDECIFYKKDTIKTQP